jgi:C4-dicarboxylate transporter DctQ subunit
MCFRFLQVTWSFLKTGELPHHDHGHVDGLEDVVPPVDFDPLSMDDNLHPHDLVHPMVGERRTGSVRRKEAGRDHAGSERRVGPRRSDDQEGEEQ